MKTIIYLAGGMNSSWQDSFIENLPDIEFVDPRKHGLTTEAEYTAWDLAGIRRSSLVVAFMDSENPSGFGLSLEVGYAHALGLPVWYVCEDTTPRQRFFGMVRACASREFSTAGDCIQALKTAAPSPVAQAPAQAGEVAEIRRRALEEAARACEKLAEERFNDHGTREPDTGACYYGGRVEDEYQTRDEEDDECAKVIRALATQPLAAPVQQEAEAVAKPFGWYGESRFNNDFTTNQDTSRRWHANGYRLTPLYATPPAHPVLAPVVREPLNICLDEEMSVLLRQTIGDAEPCAIRLQVGDGHSGWGLYVSLVDYPEEGAVQLAPIQATTGEQSHGY